LYLTLASRTVLSNTNGTRSEYEIQGRSNPAFSHSSLLTGYSYAICNRLTSWEVVMVKSRSRDVMESRKRHPEMVRLELIIHSDVKDQFKRLQESNRLTNSELFTRMVQAGLSDREQATDTTLCSPAHLDKLKWLAGCCTVTPEAMMERLIDSEIEEQQLISKRKRIHETDSMVKPLQVARFLLELYDGDRETARKEYYEHLRHLNPDWVFHSSSITTDVSRLYGGVKNQLRMHPYPLEPPKRSTLKRPVKVANGTPTL